MLIQGGMGVAVSNWRLAREVARCGQLGVVSGTAINTVLVRRLQDGDPTGDVRRAMALFPDQTYASEVLARFSSTVDAAEENPTRPPAFRRFGRASIRNA